jgi:hypothetical protein
MMNKIQLYNSRVLLCPLTSDLENWREKILELNKKVDTTQLIEHLNSEFIFQFNGAEIWLGKEILGFDQVELPYKISDYNMREAVDVSLLSDENLSIDLNQISQNARQYKDKVEKEYGVTLPGYELILGSFIKTQKSQQSLEKNSEMGLNCKLRFLLS